MARWYGTIGFELTTDGTDPEEHGVSKQVVIERRYYGDLTKDLRKFSNGYSIVDNLDVSNSLSIVADAFAYEHFHTMKYVELYGARWKISSVEIQRPRLILSIGGVYNGPEA